MITMNKRLMSIAIAALATASVTLGAQAPQTPSTPQPPDNPQPTAMQTPNRATPANPSITITGCLKEEKDVPALKPNVAERAGITEDYILTNVKMSPSSAVSGIGVSTKYEIEGIAEAELKKHLNHQVELTGQVVQPAADASDTAPDFRATSLKMISATCGAAQ
jgi:glucose/arabinose dehydrogenase